MAKKRITTDWYRLDKIHRHDTPAYIIIGMRSNGKSYAVKEEIINRVAIGEKFAYIRRLKSYISRAKMSQLFDDMKDVCNEKLGSEIFFNPERGFYIIDENMQEKIIGHAFCIEKTMDYKSTPWVGIRIIMFDEFMDYSYYDDETTRYINLLSTITRDAITTGSRLKVYLIANTITKYCPYFDLYKFDVKRLKQGDFAEVTHDNGVSATLEYCKTKVDIEGIKPNNKFIGFDTDESVKMVLYGEWETKNYSTKYIDDIGWNCKQRYIIPIYLTANGCTYELSIKTTNMPVAFVRKLNTQHGEVNTFIRYNLTLDHSVKLLNKNGVVPTITRECNLIDDNTLKLLQLFHTCVGCGRVLFTDAHTGTDFMLAMKEIKRRG